MPSAPGTTFAPPLADAPAALPTHQPRIVHLPHSNAVHLLAPPLARTPRHGPCRRGPASRLPCATRRHGPSPLLRSGPLFRLRTASAGAAVTGFRIMSCSGVRASSSVLSMHAVSPFSTARRTRAFRLATLVGVRVAGCGLRPVPASAPRPALVSALPRTPLPSPPAACFARLPSAPPHRPPLSRRGGSRPPGPPASIPLRLNPWFLRS